MNPLNSLRKATLLALAQRYCVFVIQLVTSMVLARLLTPSESGIFSLAMALVAAAQMLRDFGMGEFVLKQKEVTRQQLRSVMGASLIVSWALAALLAAAAAPIALRYDNPGVEDVLWVLALNFVLLPLGSGAIAMMNRELAFKDLFIVNVGGTLAGAAACIALATAGHSYMSLAWSSVFASFATIVLLLVVRPRLTLMWPAFNGLSAIGRFGGAMTVGRMADQAARRVPDFLISGTLGFHALGIHSKASTLLDAFHDFFASALSRVATPAFALHRHAQGDLKAAYLSAIGLTSLFPMLFFGGLMLFAEPLVRVMFGIAWLDMVPLVRICAVSGVLSAPYLLAPALLIAHGDVGALLRIQLPSAALILLAVVATVSQGLLVMALAVTVAGILKLALMHRELARCLSLSSGELLAATARSWAVAACAMLVALPCSMVDGDGLQDAVLALLTGALCLGGAAIVAICRMRHPLAAELRLAGGQKWMPG